eukprot:9076427-Heterocapsa_arctica.AAC.1
MPSVVDTPSTLPICPLHSGLFAIHDAHHGMIDCTWQRTRAPSTMSSAGFGPGVVHDVTRLARLGAGSTSSSAANND